MQTIELDLAMRRIVPLLHAKQNDVGKKVAVVLTDNGAAYSIPGDVVFSVWYSGVSGDGNYTAIDGRSAFSVSGNTVTVELITQMLQNKGPGQLCLLMNKADGTQLGLWNIPYFVEEIPGAGSEEATAYYTAFLEAAQAMGTAGIESPAHPGCYYRIVDGQTEWINPPMVHGVEYRTTERHLGAYPVYTKLLSFGVVEENNPSRIFADAEPGDIAVIRHSGRLGECSIPYDDGGDQWKASAYTSGNSLRLLCGDGWINAEVYPWFHQVWYIKFSDVLG